MSVEFAQDISATETTGKLSSMPILILNLHENCNCRCMMCDIWKRPAGSELRLEALSKHAESFRSLGIRHVVLTGGEPLLHSRFADLCAFLKELDVTITLLTTGLLLHAQAERVSQGVDDIIISLDGPEHIHDAIRRVRRGFDLIRLGIRAVRALRPCMKIHARSTVQRTNYAFLRETVVAAHRLGFDSISFLATDVSSHAFNRELIWPGERQAEIALSNTDISILEDEMEELIAEHSDDINAGFIVEKPEKLRRIVRHFREVLGELPYQAPTCNAPWVSAVIEVDGSVKPCFFHRKVSNLSASTLAEAVNSPQAQQFRRDLDIANDPVCRRCVCSLNYRHT